MNLPLTVVEVRLRRTLFTGYAVAVHTADEVATVIASLKRPQCYVPHAYRLLKSEDSYGVPPDSSQGANDDGDKGVAEKLLHLLKQWDVENVLVAVRRDESRSLLDHDYLGARRYKICVHCAKAVLQLCYAEQEPDQLTPPKKVPCDLTDALPVDREVDSCGVVRVPPPGQINNFTRDVPARRPKRAGALTNVQRSEIRFMRRPHNDVHVVLRCVCALIDGTHWLDDQHKDWIDVRSFLTDASFNDRFAIRTTTLLDNRRDDDDDPANHAISNLLFSKHLGPKAHDRLRAKSTVAAHFFPWLWSCLSPPQTRQQICADDVPHTPPCFSPSCNDDDFRAAGLKLAPPSRPCDATFIGGRIEAMPTIVA